MVIFIYEPFDFPVELAAAVWSNVAPGLRAPVVSRQTLIEMKRVAGRPQDLADIAEMEAVRKLQASDE